jgi:DNA invertase Pin-like site-specific DNA recombinase
MQYKGGQACRKLNWELVDKMREGFRNGLKIKDMSYNYNVSKSTVWKIVNNFAWIK